MAKKAKPTKPRAIVNRRASFDYTLDEGESEPFYERLALEMIGARKIKA